METTGRRRGTNTARASIDLSVSFSNMARLNWSRLESSIPGRWFGPNPTREDGVFNRLYYHGLLLYLGGECRKRDPNAKFGGGEAFDENEAYDPKSNTWLTRTRLPGGRQAIGAATDGSAAYVPGGTLRCGGLSLTDQMLVFQLK